MSIKEIVKRIIIKICRFSGYEIIDQNQFSFPSLYNNNSSNLSTLNKRSIIVPLGEVKISRRVESLLIVVRTNSNVHISDQNKNRIFNEKKIEYISRSLNSLVNSILSWKNKYKNFNIKLSIIDQSKSELMNKKFNEIFKKLDFKVNIIHFDKEEFKDEIKADFNKDIYGNLASLLKCFKTAKENTNDLVLFLEDDYLHKISMIEEMILTYERISSQTKKELILLPSDYPFFYMEERETNVLIGSHRHWQTVDKVLCSFLTSNKILNEYWNNFLLTCQNHNEPIEKYLNEICKKEISIAPIPSLSTHLANVNSIFGISPYLDIKKDWESNKNLE